MGPTERTVRLAAEIGSPHATYMRYIVLALFLGGCAENLDSQTAPQALSSEWAITINRGDPEWSCVGELHLAVSSVPGQTTGSWSCGAMKGTIADGSIAPNGTIAFTLGGDALSRFLGVLDGGKFSGHAIIRGGELPLIATAH